MVVLLWHSDCVWARLPGFIFAFAPRMKMYGIIKDNKLMGLYHSKDYCPNLFKELRLHGGEIHTLNRKVDKKNKFHCRFCIYIEAEEKGINCFEICPQKTCLKLETLPEEMRREVCRHEAVAERTLLQVSQ